MTTSKQLQTTHVEVRVRHYMETPDEASYLCHAPVSDLEELLTLIGRWGLGIDGTDYMHPVGRFAVEKNEAFFEIIAGGEDD